jgi:tRNA (cmo5U34)-methyltransferase
MTDSQPQWTEADSELYQNLAPVAVPARAEQIAALLTLLPFKQDQAFQAVEVGCGEGILSYALLDCFSEAQIIALDGSVEMRQQAAARLEPFGSRARIEPFDLHETNWFAHLQGVGCVVSSLCLHHLDAQQKQRLFSASVERVAEGGVLLIADLIEPQRPEPRELFAATWDRLAQAQSQAETGSSQLFETLRQTEWNYFRYDDPMDQPSPLADQMILLKEAGFQVADCFWLQAGHAIYGGYKLGPDRPGGDVTFEAALRSARHALETTHRGA